MSNSGNARCTRRSLRARRTNAIYFFFEAGFLDGDLDDEDFAEDDFAEDVFDEDDFDEDDFDDGAFAAGFGDEDRAVDVFDDEDFGLDVDVFDDEDFDAADLVDADLVDADLDGEDLVEADFFDGAEAFAAAAFFDGAEAFAAEAFAGLLLRLPLAIFSSSFSLIDFAMLFDGPLSLLFGVSPRLADSAAPAAFCCAFDLAGMGTSIGYPGKE